MSDNYFNFVFHFDPSASVAAHANDNVDWTADPRLAVQTVLECRRRYLQIDRATLSQDSRARLDDLLSTTLMLIQLAWQGHRLS